MVRHGNATRVISASLQPSRMGEMAPLKASGVLVQPVDRRSQVEGRVDVGWRCKGCHGCEMRRTRHNERSREAWSGELVMGRLIEGIGGADSIL
jgi:hypothetical protein